MAMTVITMKMNRQHLWATQQGSALLVSMIILMAMTIIGLNSMGTTVLEERMASNMRDKNLAFQAAEAAVRAAEKVIDEEIISTNSFDTDGSDGYYNNADYRLWEDINWDDTDSIEYTDFDSTYGVKSSPRYVIQHISTIGDAADELNLDNYGQGTGAGNTETFLITARATGGSDDTAVIIQTTWGKRL
jgi:type IV pilus assembly protein PilX